MKLKRERILVALLLAVLSVVLYYLHFIVFKDSHHIFIYALGDLAFLPLEIVFVSLIFHKIIEDKEKKKMVRKLNMLIGVFFSEIGTKLLELLADSDKNIDRLKNKLVITNSWTKKDYDNAGRIVDTYNADVSRVDLGVLKSFLGGKRDFMLKIIENPTLLEHEYFSELMMSIFHLQEELANRKDIVGLASNDSDHITIDIARVYSKLLKDWILYAQHLKAEYPYLFSFVLRTNPFDDNAKVEIS